MPSSISRRAYAEMFGPTTGDRVRLADTALVIEVERDFTVYAKRSSSEEARRSATAWVNRSASTARSRTRPAIA